MLRATMPTKPAAIHLIVQRKRSIDARFMSAPNGWRLQGEDGGREIPPPYRCEAGFYCASALYFVRESRRSASAASGSPPFFLTPSPQVLTSGSDAFFHCAVCSGVSL